MDGHAAALGPAAHGGGLTGADAGVRAGAPSLVRVRPPASARPPRLRLVCFPYAGGGAWTFRGWPGVPADGEAWAVELPGHGARIAEPPVGDLEALVAPLARAIAPLADAPLALFGHSMGALLAFETARRLRAEAGVEPVHLFVAGREAPQLPEARPPAHGLPDEELVAVLRDLDGTPSEVLEDAGMMALMLPVVRADFRLVETYRYRAEAPLGCPITAIGGADDARVRPAMLAPWREHTRAAFALHLVDGGHFFLPRAAPLVSRALEDALRAPAD